MEDSNVEISDCSGTLKSLDEETNDLRRQNYLYTKDKTDEADRKRAQQQVDNLLRNSPLIKLQGKTNFLP